MLTGIFGTPVYAVALMGAVGLAQQAAQTAERVDREARKIFETVMSPYCPGRTIANCPSPDAADLQEAIRDALGEGQTPEQVKEDLFATFGDGIRSVPRASGFGLVAWVIPGAAILLGALLIARWMRKTGKELLAAPERAPSELDSERKARLDAALSDLESVM